ncbi:MAG: hypothetical protein ABII13_04450 [Patescibacteria group bacterium]|nr:hypothetical protein [Patescibacteria group bacterium]
MSPTPEIISEHCFLEDGQLMSKPQCRAAIINHLILNDMIDIDEAEDTADKALRESGLWPEEKPGEDIDIREDLP